ncbi:MAG TPA: BcsE family c-di-GMP-binding protein [Gallionellaceae bacterium]|nr:BcsE family c-di-GMP-binding protein [Gallionellaceae bacterium]
MSQTLIQLKTLGIPGVPTPINMLLKGSIYAAILDSVPAHLSIIIQALKSNLSAGNTCVLVTPMTPRVFLSMAETSGVDFGEDIAQSRLFLFSQQGEYASNIFRHGIKRLLQEFDYFGVPKGSFFLFDQAEELFTLSDPNIAVTQANDYGDWMRSMENTSLFLFLGKGEKKTRSILNCFNGVVQINQSKTGIELLVDFWYSQDGAIAAKAFPVSLDATGLIRVDPALIQTADEAYPADSSTDDHNTVFYFGPDFESFAASIHHTGVWIPVTSFVDLIHLSRNAARATIIIALGSNSDLQQTAKIVHYLRLERGNRLRIVIREAGFSLRYLNELLLLRFGANLIIHQQLAKQQLQLLWEMLAGQTYTRKISQDFDLTHSSILSSSYKGYVDLVNFCNESLGMFERGDILDIPLVLIIANYHEHASPPEVLSQITIERNGDFFSSDAAHCYIFIHACAEENIAAALSRITGDKQASLFPEIRFITAKESIRETLLSIVQSGDIALVPDFSEAIAQLNPGYKPIDANNAITATSPAVGAPLITNAAELDPDPAETVPIEDTLMASSAAIANPHPAGHYRKTQKRNRNTIILQT